MINGLGVLKIILTMEMLAGNPTLSPHIIDAVAREINDEIGAYETITPAEVLVPFYVTALQRWGVQMGAR